MFKILKWSVIGAVAFGAAGYFLFGGNALNYLSTMASSVKESVRGQIPIDFELKRAGGLILQIGPEIRESKRDLARAEVQLEHLMSDVDRLDRACAKAEAKLKAGASMLTGSDGKATYRLAGYDYSRDRVEIDLERTFEVYKSNKALLESKRALIQRESQAVAAARKKLDAVRAEKSRLADMVGALKAQKHQIDAMAASSKNFNLDDSALGKAKEVLAQVKERLDVAQKMLADDEFFAHGVHPEKRASRDIGREIKSYFDGSVVLGNPGGNPAGSGALR